MKLPPESLRNIPGVNGLDMHVFEAGDRNAHHPAPRISELAYSWMKMLARLCLQPTDARIIDVVAVPSGLRHQAITNSGPGPSWSQRETHRTRATRNGNRPQGTPSSQWIYFTELADTQLD